MDKVKINFRNKRYRDIIWSILNTYGTSVVSFFFVIVLTRLIIPETFGLVAKYISIILVVNVIVEAGRTTNLSRKKYITNADLDIATMWILIRGIMAIILFNLLAIYFAHGEIESWKISLISLIVLFSALQSIPVMLLVRNKCFKTKATISVFSALTSGLISVGIALYGDAFYALVIGQLFNSILVAFLSYKYCNYNFEPKKIKIKPKRLFASDASIFIMLSNLSEKSIQALMYNLVGAFYGLDSLGYITRAETLRNATSTALSKAVNRVSYSYNVSAFNETNRSQLGSHLFFQLVFAIFSLPLIMLLGIFSDSVVLVLFGTNWLLVSEYLNPILCFGFVLSLITFNNAYFISIGLLKTQFYFNTLILALIGTSYFYINYINAVEFLWVIVFASSFVYIMSFCFLIYVSKKPIMNNG